MDYIFKKRRKEVLFTSSLAVAQTITRLQTTTSRRKAYTSEEVVPMLKKLLNKFTLVNLTADDVFDGLDENCKDLEDNIHFILSPKVRCECILTNNEKDFVQFNIPTFKPILRLAKLNFK
ncbi:MAG: hypothetical protein J6Y37_09515 [Paludibacteraceae bacterium]|nr:hypothetical protein [Paludibacteraceae bacterium]